MNRTPAFSLPRVLGAWLLLLPGCIAFQPVFGGVRGYLPGLLGILFGGLIALLAIRFRWSGALWLAAFVVVYLIVGGPLVVPETTAFGFLPTIATVSRLGELSFQGWYDILTVATPAGDLSGPQAVPFFAGLLVGMATIGIVRLTRGVVWPCVIAALWLALGNAFGSSIAPTAIWLGVALGVGVLAWSTAHRLSRMGAANAAFLVRRPGGLSHRTWQAIAATAVIALAAGAALSVNAATGAGERVVLRDFVSPPLDLAEYPSPLTRYRRYELNLKDEVLFKVSGLPAGGRLRLAVMDRWDGVVFNVSQDSSEYLQVGREMPWQPSGEAVRADITAELYDDVWLPSWGEPARIEFSGTRAMEQGKGLYFNRDTHQAMTVARFSHGSSVTVESVPIIPLSEAERANLKDAAAGDAPLAQVTRVPEVLAKNAAEWTAGAASAFEELEMIEQRLRTEGYYSDGSDNRSRAGHTAERLAYMFNRTQWVGDDEQYASAMALMATQRGIPARVVMGFYPGADAQIGDVWSVRGTEAHVWVEAYLEGAGWVTFDPTPDRDKVPETEDPQPKPKPKPRVDTPPSPPEHIEDDTVIADEEEVEIDDRDKEESRLAAILAIIAAVGGGIGLVAFPFLLIAALKARRALQRRKRGELTDQLAGAWSEVMDRARDLGYEFTTDHTRRESAYELQKVHPQLPIREMADRIDSSVFGPEKPSSSLKESVWKQATKLKSSLLASRPWYARPAAVFSLKSFRRSKTEAARGSRKRSADNRSRRQGKPRN
ncbi:MAG: transglutaminase domain-containing protein [Propionibacteriaceae bacterium]|nr:transglutaminase domain-containing protein [Propionibacteriaceae bacterium]